ncbi:PREDICTED: uncharacterized protein LOC106127824 isoform X2 [Papilio xuthus]|uniref:Uncharacterized protein LOC106127824 isoform X2 n=1 Tax=Papilio xuthus TaxID=66420 RepID=A0AAJ6ZYI7_PAPXU|nr:PREDICTED: uncharacterized protein LOC106127824 isoform X2 [Papilio xuthus]
MSCLFLIVVLAVHSQAYVTEPPSLAKRLDRLYEKIERFNLAQSEPVRMEDKLNAKLAKLNALTPVRLGDEDEELVSAMQLWGDMSEDQVKDVVRELQQIKEQRPEDKVERMADGEYGDSDWNDEELFLQDLSDVDYASDGEGWELMDDPESSTLKGGVVVPSAITRQDGSFREVVISAVDPVAATNERPRILDDSNLTASERKTLRLAALENMRNMMRTSKCSAPQPRWLPVRQLAPAADTVYMPPCVRLHRCAPDAGCCYSEAEVCAPVEGKYVAIPLYLNKVDRNLTIARMLFFNHTRCACVSRDTLRGTLPVRAEPRPGEGQEWITERPTERPAERHPDWRPTEEPLLERDEEHTPPPQMRRCTCPVLFTARVSGGECACVCETAEGPRRRGCLSLARGREHFGLRDRVCVAHGDCAPPACDHGPYDRTLGVCPLRKYRRIRYNRKFHTDKTAL